MIDMGAPVTIIVALIALAGGASVTALINVIARRKVTAAEADSVTVESSVKLMERQQQQILRGDKKLCQAEAKIEHQSEQIESLREELINIRSSAAQAHVIHLQEVLDLQKELAIALAHLDRLS